MLLVKYAKVRGITGKRLKLNTKQNEIPTENYQNAHHPVNLNSGHQNFNIPNADSRQPPKIEKHQTVEDILGKLHARESVNNTDTQEEMSNNNDRIVSDTSEARRRGRKLMFFPRVMYHYDINLSDPELFSKKRSIDQKHSAEKTRARGYIE